ncbi:ABC transporter permease [Serinibacter arcticus]|uniref:ABC transporter permease n=1 Tax=Serinibacter arcticus TaxID=1655435 RepID=A0A2U1ZZU4_9MICO|nr:ABC transporter permease [Serinibacter arcticus]
MLARLGTAAVVLLAAVTVTFLAVYAAPGHTVDLILGENRDDQQLRAEIIALWGLDRPLLVQYSLYVTGLFRGDLGTSYLLRAPVSEVLGAQLGSTVALTFSAFALAVVIALTLALLTSGRVGPVRRIASGLELVLLSIPSFWIGIVLLAVFSFQLGWFSVAGGAGWRSLALPALALALPIAGLLSQVLREGLDRALREPFALTARSRGVSPLSVRTRHGLRHASLPGLQIAGIVVGSLLGGTVIVEQVFGRPGLGGITVDAVYGKDLPVVLGVALVAAATFVAVSTLVDLLTLAIDPRLRSGARRRGGAPALGAVGAAGPGVAGTATDDGVPVLVSTLLPEPVGSLPQGGTR